MHPNFPKPFLLPALFLLGLTGSSGQTQDARILKTGMTIPDESYSDQPYLVKTADGAWLCVLTTGTSHEGASGQHVVSQRSLDGGKTWVDKRDVEPPDGPEASYAVLLKAPSGRVFVFYNHNTDNLRAVRGDNPPYPDGQVKRVDSQGYFVFKYSDDGGKSWSPHRYTIPVRAFDIDRKNPYGGNVRFFWNVGRAFAHRGAAYVPLIKVGGFGDGFFTSSEGALLRSADLFSEKDPANATWTTLPDGDAGLRTPPGGGPVAEEQSYAVLSDGSFFAVYRTVDGHPATSYSRDGGRTWATPHYLRYADGRPVKHPRAANFVWKCENGKYLYWFENHGGRAIAEHPNRRGYAPYADRNPAWVLGGVEADSPQGKIIRWSQPEILLYDDDPVVRISYPDLLEDGGAYYLTETQKDVARTHRLDPALLTGLWRQFDVDATTAPGTVVDWTHAGGNFPQSVPNPTLPEFYKADNRRPDGGGGPLRGGFTVELDFTLRNLAENQLLADARTPDGRGWAVRTTARQTVEIILHDGQTQAVWACDEGELKANRRHRVSVVVDGGPNIISFVVDGRFNDGGKARQFGWGRFSPYLKSVNGAPDLRIGTHTNGTIHRVAVYNRAITVSEAVGNFRAARNRP